MAVQTLQRAVANCFLLMMLLFLFPQTVAEASIGYRITNGHFNPNEGIVFPTITYGSLHPLFKTPWFSGQASFDFESELENGPFRLRIEFEPRGVDGPTALTEVRVFFEYGDYFELHRGLRLQTGLTTIPWPGSNPSDSDSLGTIPLTTVAEGPRNTYLQIRPLSGLEPGRYVDVLYITSSEGLAISIPVSFAVKNAAGEIPEPPSPDTETVTNSETVGETETVKESETMEETETVKESETIEETETVEETGNTEASDMVTDEVGGIYRQPDPETTVPEVPVTPSDNPTFSRLVVRYEPTPVWFIINDQSLPIAVNLIPGYSISEQLGTGIAAVLPHPKQEGYRFRGWYLDIPARQRFTLNTPIHEGMSITAYFRPKPQR